MRNSFIAAAALILTSAGLMFAQRVDTGSTGLTPRRLLTEDLDANVGGAPFSTSSGDGRLTAIAVPHARPDNRRDLIVRDTRSGVARTILSGLAGTNPSFDWTPLSRDGQQIAYRDRGQLNVVGTAAGASAKALPGSAGGSPLAWSPDAQRLLIALSNDQGGGELAWLDAVGHAPRQTVIPFEQWRRPDGVGAVSLSPKGDWIAFSVPARVSSRDHHIYVVGADGQHETDVVKIAGSSTQPVWTPDGSHLVFVNDGAIGSAGRSLWAVTMQGGIASGEPKLVRTGFAGTPIGISDAGDLYFGETMGGDRLIEIRGTGTRAQAVFRGQHPRWSPDGKSIGFQRGEDYIVRTVATGDERRVIHQSGWIAGRGTWLHDSSALVAIVYRPGPTGPEAWFHVVSADGTSVRQLSPLRSPTGIIQEDSPSVSPDDKTVYTLAGRRNPTFPYLTWTGIAAIDVMTGMSRQIATLPVEGPSDSLLAMSPDGETFAVFNSGIGLMIRKDGTGSRTVDGLPFISSLRWTDGRNLTVSFLETDGKGGKRRLMLMPIEGGVLTPHPLESLLARNFTFDLSPDGRLIATCVLEPLSRELWVIDNFMSAVANVK